MKPAELEVDNASSLYRNWLGVQFADQAKSPTTVLPWANAYQPSHEARRFVSVNASGFEAANIVGRQIVVRPQDLAVGLQPQRMTALRECLIVELGAIARGVSRGNGYIVDSSDIEHDVVVKMEPLNRGVIRIRPSYRGKAEPKPIIYSD